MAILTLKKLKAKGACGPAVDLFKAKWGEKLEVTEEAFVAAAQEFDWWWGAYELLKQKKREQYMKVMEDAENEFDKSIRALRERRDNCGWASNEYDALCKEVQELREKWNEERAELGARTFARLYNEQEDPKPKTDETVSPMTPLTGAHITNPSTEVSPPGIAETEEAASVRKMAQATIAETQIENKEHAAYSESKDHGETAG